MAIFSIFYENFSYKYIFVFPHDCRTCLLLVGMCTSYSSYN
ncbi:hypothetical protein HZS_1349 [Henneguya salminicola]|nr:hypothetical protein HZS_1349 [Henneguya salminicola]